MIEYNFITLSSKVLFLSFKTLRIAIFVFLPSQKYSLWCKILKQELIESRDT